MKSISSYSSYKFRFKYSENPFNAFFKITWQLFARFDEINFNKEKISMESFDF